MWTYYRVDNWYHNNGIIIEATIHYQVNKIVNNSNNSSSSSSGSSSNTRHDTLTYTHKPQNTQHIFIHAHTYWRERSKHFGTTSYTHTRTHFHTNTAKLQVMHQQRKQQQQQQQGYDGTNKTKHLFWLDVFSNLYRIEIAIFSICSHQWVSIFTYVYVMSMMSLYLNVLWLRFFGRMREMKERDGARACKQISCEQQFIKIKCEFCVFCVKI